MSENPFDGLVIHAYTDEMALADGVVIDCASWGIFLRDLPQHMLDKGLLWTVVNRVTPALVRVVEDGLLTNLAGAGVHPDVIAASRSLVIRSAANSARMTPDNPDGHLLIGHLPLSTEPVWFEQNETGLYTAMLPSDH